MSYRVDDSIVGVQTSLGVKIKAKKVIITAGTFLNGLIHIGDKTFGGGRAGERASTGITEDLVKKGFEAGFLPSQAYSDQCLRKFLNQ